MRNLKNGYFSRTFQATLIISIIVLIELSVPSLLYAILRAFTVSVSTSLLVAFASFGGLVILGLPFVPSSVLVLRGDADSLPWKLPLRIKILLGQILSIPKEFINHILFIALLIFILGSILILLGVSGFTQDQQVIMNGHASTATVIDYDCSNYAICVPLVQFKTLNGEVIRASTRCCATVSICVLGRCISEFVAIGEGTAKLEIGQNVPVIYDPNNPKIVQLQIQGSSQTPLTIQTIDFLTYGIILIFLGLLCSLLIFTLALSKYIVSHIKKLEGVPPLKRTKEINSLSTSRKERSHFKSR